MNGRNDAPDSFDAGRSSDYDGVMEARIAKIESKLDKSLERLCELATELAIIKANYVTKADLLEMGMSLESKMYKSNSELMWRLITFVCGFNGALVTAIYLFAKYVH